MSDDKLTIKYIPLSLALLWDDNKKRHDIPALISSFKRHGFKDSPKFEPQLNKGEGGIVEGNGRFIALDAMRNGGDDPPRGVAVDDDGSWLVPVTFGVDAISEAAAKAYGVDHNALTLSGGDFDLTDHMRLWEDGFEQQLEELAQMDEAPVVFDAEDIEALLSLSQEPPEDPGAQIDKAEELRKKWQVESGQLWRVGEHRIICCDCTDDEVVARVMDGEKADCVVTDPPYGVGYADKNRFLNTIARGNRIQEPITGDHGEKVNTQALWKSAFCEMEKVMLPGAVVYCFMPQGGDQMMMMMMMNGVGIEPRHELIWLKNNHVLGRVDYAYKHEPILYAWKDGGHKFYGDFQTSILEFPRPQKSDLHPTTKPVELIERLIANSSKPNDVIYDPFLGSGTTAVACERLGRKFRGVEIEPKYVAVCLERLAGMGLEPELLEYGNPIFTNRSDIECQEQISTKHSNS